MNQQVLGLTDALNGNLKNSMKAGENNNKSTACCECQGDDS